MSFPERTDTGSDLVDHHHPPTDQSGGAAPPSAAAAGPDRTARILDWAAIVVLTPVAVIGAVLSFRSLYTAAQPTFGPYLAAGFPALVDFLILGASLKYVASARRGRPVLDGGSPRTPASPAPSSSTPWPRTPSATSPGT